MTTSTPESHPEFHKVPHEPNPVAPNGDGTFVVEFRSAKMIITLELLASLPQTEYSDCYVASTGHAKSGPYRFEGVTLRDVLTAAGVPPKAEAKVKISGADGYEVEVSTEPENAPARSPSPLLATQRDGVKLTRELGLVRVIVPTETEDALLQLKWIKTIRVHSVEDENENVTQLTSP